MSDQTSQNTKNLQLCDGFKQLHTVSFNATLGTTISFKNNRKAEGSCSNMENIKNK